MAKIKTINVIENIGGVMGAIHAFTDDEQGKEEAEAFFSRIVREWFKSNDYDDDDPDIDTVINDSIMDGVFDSMQHNQYEVIITWSA